MPRRTGPRVRETWSATPVPFSVRVKCRVTSSGPRSPDGTVVILGRGSVGSRPDGHHDVVPAAAALDLERPSLPDEGRGIAVERLAPPRHQHAGVRGRFRREPDLARLGQDRFRRPVRCRRGQVVKGVQHGVGGGLDVGERLGRRRQNLVEARLLAVALGGGVGESGALEELLGEGERTVGGDGGLAQEEMNVRSGVTGPGRTGDDGGGVRGAVGGRTRVIGVQAVLRGGEPAAGVEVGRDPLADGLLDVGELFRGERRFGGDRQGEGDVTGPVATGVGGSADVQGDVLGCDRGKGIDRGGFTREGVGGGCVGRGGAASGAAVLGVVPLEVVSP
ncbi:hypothetical protein SFUMM280S_11283 [Streptomyces fumanus]